MLSPTNSHSDDDISPDQERPAFSVLRCQWPCTSCSSRTTGLLGDEAAGRKRRGKPRFGRSLTLPGASPYLRRGSRAPSGLIVITSFSRAETRLKPWAQPRVYPIGANLFCCNIFEPGFCGTWKIRKGHAPVVANRPWSLPDLIQAPPRVEFDGE
jgi:hypothetical protein